MDRRKDFLWPLRVLCSAQSQTLMQLHLEISACDALTSADMSACMFHGYFCCTSHVNLQPNHCLWQICGGWLSAALWDAYQAISHIRFAAFHQRGLCGESAPLAYLKLVLPCSYCDVSHTWVLSFSYHTYNTCQSIPLAPSYLCAPISPLCCLVLPASSPPYHLQWKSNGLIPAPAGSPHPHP